MGVQARREARSREAGDGHARRVVPADCQDQALGLGGGVRSPLRPTVIRVVVRGYPLIYSASNAITCSPWDTDGGAAKNGAILLISSSY